MTKQNQTMELSNRRTTVPPVMENSPRAGVWPGLVQNGDGGGPLERVERSIHYMIANINRPLQVSTLAAQANVSPSHFFALFKQMTGRPPMDYFIKLRMSHACRLLDSTTASVKEVAAALGYDDPLYFSRVFKSVSAVAPVHYRGLGFASRREIKDQLEPKEKGRNGDSLRRSAPGRMAAKVSTPSTKLPLHNQYKTNPQS